MSYVASTDFLALLRQTGPGVEFARAPGLDIILSGLARAGMFRLWVGQNAPSANQSTTAWLQPSEPSWTAEGTLWLWNAATGQYVLATPALWSALLAPTVTPAAVPTLVFQTVAAAALAIIPALVTPSILVIRHAVGSEAAVATYVPGVSVGPGAFQDAGGTWWQLDLSSSLHYASWYGVKGDNLDYHVELQSALTFANSIEVRLPPGTVGLGAAVGVTTTVQGAASMRLSGAGGAGQTIIDNRVAAGGACIFAHGAPNAFGYYGFLKDIKFISTTVSPVPFFDLLAQYKFVTENCQFSGVLNSGVTITNNLGDPDASNQILFRNCQFTNNGGAGLLHNFAAGVVQTSFVRCEDCFFIANGLVGWYAVGLTHSMYNCAFTENGFGGGGQGGLWVANNAASNASFNALNCSFENNYVGSARLDGVSGGSFINCEIAGGSAGIVSGTGFQLNGTIKMRFADTRVRIGATLNPYKAWQFSSGSSDNTVVNTDWAVFDGAGQVRAAQDGTSYGNRFDDAFSAKQEGADNGVLTLNLANGANQNVALPLTGVIYSVTAGANYSIGGIAGVAPGRELVLYNNSAFVMTLNDQDAGSTAANRIQNGGTNVAVGSGKPARLTYYSTAGRWLVV